MHRYFAYGSNMNPERVRRRGLSFFRVEAARLPGYRLSFDKHAREHAGAGHASIAWERGQTVEGVLYWLTDAEQILLMDRFERAPVNYSREIVEVRTAAGTMASWTYFANPAVLRPGLLPPPDYLAHLLAGRPYLSAGYFERLARWPCAGEKP